MRSRLGFPGFAATCTVVLRRIPTCPEEPWEWRPMPDPAPAGRLPVGMTNAAPMTAVGVVADPSIGRQRRTGEARYPRGPVGGPVGRALVDIARDH